MLFIMRCEICLKSGMAGNNVSHSMRHTKTRFYANVHKMNVTKDGKTSKVKICTRCLRNTMKPARTKKTSA
ncbi:MAG TPA: 50S ribosomal protein L28 [Dehalococcoidia bacterium]|nr:50S ribosomal protein L28 [Dehalococcoidia bacterium]